MARTRQPELVFLDTHIVCWLFAGKTELLSPTATKAIENCQLYVSPMVELELEYLFEIGRITLSAKPILDNLRADIGVQIADASFQEVVTRSRTLNWTRDPFDRIIVGHAMFANASLVTRDQAIRSNFDKAIW